MVITKSKIKETVCNWCGSELIYSSKDVFTESDGISYIDCPECIERLKVHDLKAPIYPNDFYSYKDSSNVANDEINSWIKKGIEHMKTHDTSHYVTSSGRVRVEIDKYKEDDVQYLEVIVCKDYYQYEKVIDW